MSRYRVQVSKHVDGYDLELDMGFDDRNNAQRMYDKLAGPEDSYNFGPGHVFKLVDTGQECC